MQFDVDDLRAAVDALHRSSVSTLPSDRRPILRLLGEHGRFAHAVDVDAFSEVFADDAVVVDHRPVGFGEVDLDGFRRCRGQRAHEGRVETCTPELIPLSSDVLLSGSVSTVTAPDGACWQEFFFQLLLARDGMIGRLEIFGEDQRELASGGHDSSPSRARR